ncbi:MAG: glycerol-3-phosphate dehydrogenase/oxidase [Bdellovibrionales bacterium]|nr:glycerol-3-phosphate dehydrogenase/oxidase [Bdellovibrionales bacterium]
MLSAKERSKNIQQLQKQQYDLVIIGGGINGAGVARDAASRGMSVALVEANDFASGTSSRSSKLIHGGIRYLETFEFGLVFEALSERRKLFQIAPHLVHPLRFLIPLFKGDRVGMFKMGLGMWLYDALALFEAPEMHRRLNPEDVLNEFPTLKSEGLLGAYMYYDAYMDDDRLVHETLRSAARMGAIAANYVKAEGALVDKNKNLIGIECVDQISGEIFQIHGRHIVSTVGPWTDDVAEHMLGEWKEIMRPSKGIHLTFSRQRFPLKEAVVMAADQQKRVIFGIPRHEMVIVGTTDTDFKNNPSLVKSDAEDVEYLLKITNQYFPGAHLKKSDIIASYSGVRPLVADNSATESGTSREHVIISHPRNITFVAGGKYTTYRAMAEDTVRAALSHFSIEDQVKFQKSRTLDPLNPKATGPLIEKALTTVEARKDKYSFSLPIQKWLIERHGFEAFDLMAAATDVVGESEWARVWQIEARHAIRETMCLTLRDFYLRRSPLFLADKNHGFQFLNEIGQVFQEELGLSSQDLEKQINALRKHLEVEMGWSLTE